MDFDLQPMELDLTISVSVDLDSDLEKEDMDFDVPLGDLTASLYSSIFAFNMSTEQ